MISCLRPDCLLNDYFGNLHMVLNSTSSTVALVNLDHLCLFTWPLSLEVLLGKITEAHFKSVHIRRPLTLSKHECNVCKAAHFSTKALSLSLFYAIRSWLGIV